MFLELYIVGGAILYYGLLFTFTVVILSKLKRLERVIDGIDDQTKTATRTTVTPVSPGTNCSVYSSRS